MRRTSKIVTAKAVALTTPRPRRVSLCRAGANQTPLNYAKSESVTVEKEELTDMLTSLKSQGFEIASFAFEGDNWTMDAAKAWLTDGGYSGFVIKGADGDITVESTVTEIVEDSDLRRVKTSDNVTVTLVKAPELVSEEDATEKTGEPSAEDAGSVVQLVAKALADSVVAAKAAGVEVERCKSIYTLKEFVDLIRSLKWLVNDMSYETFYGDTYEGKEVDPAREQLLNQMKGIGLQMLTIFASLTDLEVKDMEEAFKSAQEETMTDTTTAAAAAAEKTEADAAAVIEGAAPEATAADAAKEDEPAADVADATEATAAAPAEADKADAGAAAEPAAPAADAAKSEDVPAWAQTLIQSFGSLTERVDAMEAAKAEKAEPEATTVVPARKSADANEEATGNSAEKSETVQRFETARLKSALGL